jgi:hypothetical protein
LISDLAIVAALLFVTVAQVALFVIRVRDYRGRARDMAARLTAATVQHNVACGAGEWPHAGPCAPKIGGPEESMVRFMMLAQSAALGAGMLPQFIRDMMAIPGPVKFEEAGRCAGDD